MKALIFAFFPLSISIFSFAIQTQAQSQGCTDPLANNFNPSAIINDGSCTYSSLSYVSASSSKELPVALDETSGLIYWNNKLWTHNDDTDINIYAFDYEDPNNYQAFSLTGTVNKDTEEISQDSTYIYMGDFGNNVKGNRTDLRILRVEKESLLAGNPIIDTIFFSYSNQIDFSPTEANKTDFDCESFIVSSDSIYLFTKQWVSEKTSCYSLSKYPGTHIANYRATLDVKGLITGAYYNRAKRLIVFSGYSSLLQPFFYLLYDFQGNDFFSGNKRKIAFSRVSNRFHQIEGVTSKNGLIYYVSNEKFTQTVTIKAKIHEIDMSEFLLNYINSQPKDTIPPVIISTHNDINLYVGNNCSVIMPDYRMFVSATDNRTASENIIFTQTPYPNQVLTKGNYQVSLKAYDEADNYDEYLFNINVFDSISPKITYENTEFFIEAETNCENTIPDISDLVQIQDNCTSYQNLEISQNPVAGSICSGENNTVILKVIDESGNSKIANFNIVITDTTSPAIECPVLDTINLNYLEEFYLVQGTELDLASYSDNCGIQSISNDYNNSESLNGVELLPGETIIKWTVIDINENTSTCETKIVILLSSIDDFELDNIKVFPNPAKNTLNINCENKKIKNIQITDIYTKTIEIIKFKNTENYILDISNYEPGTYFLNIEIENKNLKYKFIKL
jgi:hypothetical protein